MRNVPQQPARKRRGRTFLPMQEKEREKGEKLNIKKSASADWEQLRRILLFQWKMLRQTATFLLAIWFTITWARVFATTVPTMPQTTASIRPCTPTSITTKETGFVAPSFATRFWMYSVL